MTTTLNLDALDAFAALDSAGQTGKPLLLDIETVHEDPDQPRRTFDQAALAELTESVRQSGVKSPVSVKSHPSIVGHYMLNFGARRLRASKAAGLTTIPAFVDEAHTDFEQVVENLQRDGLTPMEMALFIQAKVNGGMKKGAVATKLGISNAAVSKYLVLVDGPTEIETLYSTGKCQSPDTLYEVAGLLSKWPDQTRTWLSSQGEVTRTSVDTFKRRVSTPSTTMTPAAPPIESENPKLVKDKPAHAADAIPEPDQNTCLDQTPITQPVLHVLVGGRQGVLVLNARPSKALHVVIQWEATSDREEVSAAKVQIERLADARE